MADAEKSDSIISLDKNVIVNNVILKLSGMLIISLMLLVFSSMSIHEVVQSKDNDVATNIPLFGFSLFAGIICTLVLGLIPYYMQTTDTDLLSGYMMLGIGIFGIIQSCFAGLAAIDTPQTTSVNTTLGVMAGITLLVSLLCGIGATYKIVQHVNT